MMKEQQERLAVQKEELKHAHNETGKAKRKKEIIEKS